MSENTSADVGGDASDGTEVPTEPPSDPGPGGRPWWQIAAPVVAVLVVIVGVLVYQWQRDEGAVWEAGRTSRECGFEVKASTARHVEEGDGFFVFESADDPKRYAVMEFRPVRFQCDVDPIYWDSPDEWTGSANAPSPDGQVGSPLQRVVAAVCEVPVEEVRWETGSTDDVAVLTIFDLGGGRSATAVFLDRVTDAEMPKRWQVVCDGGLDHWFTRAEFDQIAATGVVPGTSAPTSQPTTTATTEQPAPTTAPAMPEEATSAACDFEDPDSPVPEEASLCLFIHWRAEDRDVPSDVATPEAIEELFAVEWEPPDGSTEPCREEPSPYGDVVCTFVYGMDVSVDMYLVADPDGAWKVVAVGHYGNPPGF